MKISELKQLQSTDGWVEFSGQIIKVGEIRQRTKSDMSKTPGEIYNVQKLSVADNTDNISVWAYATSQFLPNQNITIRGMLKEYEGVRYVDYAKVGIAQQAANVPQQAQPPAQNAPQAPQQSRQGVQKPKEVSQDVWEAKDLRMARMNALNRAVELLIAEKAPFGNCSLLDTADLLVNYIYKHKDKGGQPNPAESRKMADEFEAGMDEGQDDVSF